MATEAYRLPTTVKPRRYDVRIDARLDDETFEGEVEIWLEIEEPTEAIELHARDLDIHEARLTVGDAPREGEALVRVDSESLRIGFNRPVPAGEATLAIAYTGEIGRGMTGLYLSEAGDDRCLATQCEATDARAILPCFDEPAFKARFAWEITTDADLTVLANTPLAERTESGGDATWRFEPTPPMSSYLCAFCIGDFGSTDPVEISQTPFRVYALGDKARLGTHARDLAGRLLPWFEDYFDTGYPYAKYDQVAVPSFSFGAMENIGLVVFRSNLLLVDPERASWDEHKAVDRVVAHEFAHMWFGNLVTMAWWDDLWLNEAFAEWIAHKVVDALEADHDIWYDFGDRTSQALETDALESTHAIYHPVETPEQAMEMFDAITYGKGSAVMRMLEAYLGESEFRDGLQSYMAAFAEGNARGEDLWHQLEQATGEPVEEIMESWITQPGHPVVSVEVERRDGEAHLVLRQQRYRSRASADPGDRTWHIPLVIRYKDDGGVHTLPVRLTDNLRVVPLDVEGELAWCYPDADDLGFYRSDPSPALIDAILEDAGSLTPAERIGVLRDQWALVESGERPVTEVLDLLDRLVTGEDHHAFVAHALGQVRALERILETHDREAALSGLRAWTRDHFEPAYRSLGVQPQGGEDPPTRQRRATVLQAMAQVGRDEDAVQAAIELARRERKDPDAIEANLAGPAVAIEASQGDASVFETHVTTYEQRRDGDETPQATNRYLSSLARFTDPELVDRTLELLADGTIPKESIGPLLERMLREPATQQAAFEHVRGRFEALEASVGEAWIARIVEASGQLDPGTRKDVIGFYETALDGLAQESFARAKERLAQRAELHARILGDLAAWFERRA